MAMLRHVALNLLKADTATKGGINVRRTKNVRHVQVDQAASRRL